MKKIVHLAVLILILSTQASCARLGLDKVLQDKRTTYQKSKALPDLELPPDLISDTIDENTIRIPGEEKNIALSTHERQKTQAISNKDNEDGQWLTAYGSRPEIWSRLNAFWQKKGYRLELDDIELGVMETTWKNYTIERDQYRNKTRVFIEDNGIGGQHWALFISSMVEIKQGNSWYPSADGIYLAEKMMTELNAYLNTAADSALQIITDEK